jgi:hypothetical protein
MFIDPYDSFVLTKRSNHYIVGTGSGFVAGEDAVRKAEAAIVNWR